MAGWHVTLPEYSEMSLLLLTLNLRPQLISQLNARTRHEPLAAMTDLTPALNQLLVAQHASPVPRLESQRLCTETADEFLKEAYRIVRTPTTTISAT